MQDGGAPPQMAGTATIAGAHLGEVSIPPIARAQASARTGRRRGRAAGARSRSPRLSPSIRRPLQTDVSVCARDELPARAGHFELLGVQVALDVVEKPCGLAVLARDAGDGEPRALPEVVVVDLRNRRAEAVLELRLRRLDELPLPLQRSRLGEVELDRKDSDVAAG